MASSTGNLPTNLKVLSATSTASATPCVPLPTTTPSSLTSVLPTSASVDPSSPMGLPQRYASSTICMGRPGGEERADVLARDEALGVGGGDNGVKGRGVGARVRRVGAVGDGLADDGGDELERGELGLEHHGLRQGRRLLGRGEDADLERLGGGELHAKDGDALGHVVVVVRVVGGGGLHSEGLADAHGNVVADFVQLREHVLLDRRRREQARLEAHGVDEELLLDRRERVVKQTRLRPVVEKGRRAHALQLAADGALGRREEAVAFVLRRLLGVTAVERVGRVGGRVAVDEHLAHAVAVVVVDGDDGAVDGELLKVGAAVAVELRVEVREDAALQQRVLGKVDAPDNVSGLELPRVSTAPVTRTEYQKRTMTCSVSAK